MIHCFSANNIIIIDSTESIFAILQTDSTEYNVFDLGLEPDRCV